MHVIVIVVYCISCICWAGTGLAVEEQVPGLHTWTCDWLCSETCETVQSVKSSPSINGAWCPVTQSFRSKGSKPRLPGSTDPSHPGSCSA